MWAAVPADRTSGAAWAINIERHGRHRRRGCPYACSLKGGSARKRGLSRQLLQHRVGDIIIRIHILNVIAVFQRLQEL
jgi:hypothetical protein